MEGIQVSVEHAGSNNNIAVIKVGGYIDTTTSAELEHSLDSLLKAGMYRIVIDLGNVDYISSAGWGIFISEIKGIRERGGDLKLIRMIPDVYEVFELLEFHYIIKAFDTLEEAVGDFDHDAGGAAPARPAVAPQKEQATYAQSSEAAVAQQAPPVSGQRSVNTNSVDDFVTKAATEHPDAGTLRLKKLLNSATYGNTQIGFFALRKRLRDLGLDSKPKRLQKRQMG
jgi:anti-sigma B factor antagonist